eukprot:COSAG03_NODE_13098_length_516_cov_309.345324_1_plen_35_part_10
MHRTAAHWEEWSGEQLSSRLSWPVSPIPWMTVTAH